MQDAKPISDIRTFSAYFIMLTYTIFATTSYSIKGVVKLPKNYSSKRITGKLKVSNYLNKSEELKYYSPVTKSFNESNLRKMFSLFPMVYVKPNVGSQGKGVVRVEKVINGYQLKTTKKTKVFKNSNTLANYLSTNYDRPLIVQQGIRLEKLKGRPYDIRAMVQRKPGGEWTVTGIFAKLGKANKIVTNYFQGGELVTMDKLYNETVIAADIKTERIELIEYISIEVANHLSRFQTNMYEMGIDFAFDERGDLWILEVNSRQPQFYPLKWIDRSMYNRILTFAKSYGRKNGY